MSARQPRGVAMRGTRISTHHLRASLSCDKPCDDLPLNYKSNKSSQLPSRVFLKPRQDPTATSLDQRMMQVSRTSGQHTKIRNSVSRSVSAAHALPVPRRVSTQTSCNFPATTRNTNNFSSAKRLSRSATTSARDGIRTTVEIHRAGLSLPSEKVHLEKPSRDMGLVLNENKRLRTRDKENAMSQDGFVALDGAGKQIRAPERSTSLADKHNAIQPLARTFLVPKTVEHQGNTRRAATMSTRLSTLHDRDLTRKDNPKTENKADSKHVFPTLPTQVLRHTPDTAAEKHDSGTRTPPNLQHLVANRSLLVREMRRTPQPPRFAIYYRLDSSSSSLSSESEVSSLPTQVIEHTPWLPHSSVDRCRSTSASESPCLSKGRSKTIWTLLDEVKLVRSGGILSNAQALAPCSNARIVPLCQRILNGIGTEGGSIQGLPPVRSASNPYHLYALSIREDREFLDVPHGAQISPKGNGAKNTRECSTEEGTTRKGHNGDKAPAPASPWTVVNVKRRATTGGVMSRRGGGKDQLADLPLPQSYNPFGAQSSKVAIAPQKLSLMTLIKLKFRLGGPLSSRKLVGRGGPGF